MQKLALLVFAVILVVPSIALADGLVNINTASESTLETLPGIGPTKASAIVAYRAEYGPFTDISGIENVSGIGPSTYTEIEALITVDGGGVTDVSSDIDTDDPDATSSADTSDTADDTSADSSDDSSNSSNTLSVQITAVHSATLGTPVMFSATVSSGGESDSAATVSWSFGDGSSAPGRSATKTYSYAGTYAVRATASDGGAESTAGATIVVVPAEVSITSVSSAGIMLANGGSASIDLSSWRLTAGLGSFTLPIGMTLLANANAFLPDSITSLPVAYDARLSNASGQLVASYVPPTAPAQTASTTLAQPSSTTSRSYTSSTISVIAPAHAPEAVRAPAASTQVAAAGAALPDDAGIGEDAAPASPAKPSGLVKVLESPWALGGLGLLVFSGGALIVL